MESSPVIVALIGAAGVVITTVATLLATAGQRREAVRAREAERRAATKSAETERLMAERQRIDARWERFVDELQEENKRLRAALRRRDEDL